MTNLFRSRWSFLFAICTVFMMVSCGDDDPIIDGGGDGINVADGFYLAAMGEDPSSTAQLTSETVEADGFESMDRDGFIGGYMWLDAGDYNVVQVVNKEVTATIGGEATTVTDEGSSCEYNDYTVVTTEADGPAITIGTSGLYRVTHDPMLSELIVYQIDKVNIIGSATPNGWGADTDIPGSVTADGGKWEMEDVVLRNGEWKVRFNCRWSIDRRIDKNAPLDNANGYQLFVNFGGSTDDLLPGNDGSNIQVTEDGTYTMTIEWDPRDGWTVDADRTGDAPEVSFDPNDYMLGILGDATANEWAEDRNMIHKFENDVHSWYGVVTLLETGNFKIRANDNWDFNLGGTLPADGSTATLDVGGGDIPSPGAGAYYVVVSTADEGSTWNATMTNLGWSVIGEGSPSGSWEIDTDLNADGFVDGVTSYSLTGDFTTAEWKFRAGHDWKLSLGDNLGTLILDGGNLSLSEAGSYKITFTFDGADYSASAEKL